MGPVPGLDTRFRPPVTDPERAAAPASESPIESFGRVLRRITRSQHLLYISADKMRARHDSRDSLLGEKREKTNGRIQHVARGVPH